jgi:copper(I)-binding protein
MNTTRRSIAAALAIATLLLGASACSSGSSSSTVSQRGISISDAWARESAMSAGNGAAYFTIENTSDLVDKILSASVSSSVAATAQIHEMAMGEGSMMTMEEVSSVQIPAGGTVAFAPGGYHVMLIDLAQPLKAGETIDLTLGFMNAGSITVKAKVRSE